jgi:predicted nucleic acid-binding protein
VQRETTAKLFIQSLIKHGDIVLVSSFVLYSEIMETPSEYKRNSILRFVDNYASEHVGNEKTPEALPIANDIMQTGIKAFDAAHVACAILAECDYFVTTDKRLLKYKTDRIKLVNPIDFVKGWEAIR